MACVVFVMCCHQYATPTLPLQLGSCFKAAVASKGHHCTWLQVLKGNLPFAAAGGCGATCYNRAICGVQQRDRHLQSACAQWYLVSVQHFSTASAALR